MIPRKSPNGRTGFVRFHSHTPAPGSPIPVPSSPFTNRGAALLLTLWAILVLSVCLIVLSQVVDSDAGNESITARRFEARQLALTGLALAQHPDIESGDPLLFQKLDSIRRFEANITGENGRLDVNEILGSDDGKARLRDLFRFWGATPTEAGATVDSLFDWIDADDFRSLNGAERSDIGRNSPYSPPANRAFRSVSEMEGVRGMDRIASIYPGWKNAFTVHGALPMSLQDAPPELLRVFGGLSGEQAKAVVRLRAGKDGVEGSFDDVKVDSAEEAAKLIGMDPSQAVALSEYFGAAGSIKRIVSRGWCAGVRYEIAVVGERSGGSSNGVLEWSEN